MAAARAVVITGSAGGIGSALRARLEATGARVIGIDRHDADVVIDLGDVQARSRLAAHISGLLGTHQLTGVVAAAGVLGMGGTPEDAPGLAAEAVSVNYFGAVATLNALRPLLASSGHGAAVAVGSHMATTQPTHAGLVEACLSAGEEEARAAATAEPAAAYASTKLALERWVRRHAPAAEWIGRGITLNAIALGLVDTPMTAASVGYILAHPEVMPLPAGRAATADEAAAAIAFLLSDDARFFCGAVVSMDGGTDAFVRGEQWPGPLGRMREGEHE